MSYSSWDDILGGTTGELSATGLPAIGWHDARVKEARVEPTEKGGVMIVAVLEIEGGPNNGDWLWNNFVYPTPASKPGHTRMFTRSLAALGFTKEYLATNQPTPEQLAAAMVGRSVRANVIHREWDKELRASVKGLKAPGDSDDIPPTPDVGSDADELPPPPVVEAPPIPVLPDDTDSDEDDEDERPF